jgi:hypothetical protein
MPASLESNAPLLTVAELKVELGRWSDQATGLALALAAGEESHSSPDTGAEDRAAECKSHGTVG